MIDPSNLFILIAILAIAILSGRLLSPHFTRVFTLAPSRLDKILNPVERGIYRLVSVDPAHGMGWKEYFLAAVIVNIFQMAIAFVIFSVQGVLPLNPQGFPGLSWDLAFMQVISFATNTNLQHYNGEGNCVQLPNCSNLTGFPGLSYLSQMMAVQFLQFTSAATGISVAIAMIRGFIAHSKDLGNFYVDFTRSLTRVLLPLCFVASLVFVGLGVPQTLTGYERIVSTVEGATQTILVGPVASLVSVMQLGTNGGGYYGANSAYPCMNPSPASDVLEIALMLLLPTALVFVFGDMLGKKRETRPILIGAYALFAIDLAVAFVPNIPQVGAGIETRIGGFFSTFWTVVTTAVTTGSVNASLSGIHPLGVLAGFMGMLIQATPGGKGVGLMYMVMYIVITVFVVGLMSGRTPEYLGIKITGRDVKLVMVAFLIHPLIILIPVLVAYASNAVAAVTASTGSIGFTQILWEFTTSAANNGSDFLGTSANTLAFNVSTAAVIFVGRYAPIGLLLALAGSMMGRKRTMSEGGLKTDSIFFSIVFVGSIIVLVVLTFFPFLALGPILSYFQGKVNGFG